MSEIAIEVPDTGHWHVLLDNKIMTWNDPDWFNVASEFGADTITLDMGAERLGIVGFPSEAAAKLAIDMRQRYRKFAQEIRELQSAAHA